MSTSSSLMKLSQELLEIVLEVVSETHHLDLISCMLVCQIWYPLARKLFYKNTSITKYSKAHLFINCLTTHNYGHFIVNLNISYKSRWNSRSFFMTPDECEVLVNNCQNIVNISMSKTNPFYILCSLENLILPKLQQINVCWKTCSTSPSMRKRFYGANINHNSSIKYIHMPGNSLDEIQLFVDGAITIFSRERFFNSFPKLEKYDYEN